MEEAYMGVLIQTDSLEMLDGQWRSQVVLQVMDGAQIPVFLPVWPSIHRTKVEADVAAISWARRLIRRGSWNTPPSSSGYQPL